MLIGNGLHHFEGTLFGISFAGTVVALNQEQGKILEQYKYDNRNFKLGNAAVINSSYLPCQSTCKIENTTNKYKNEG